MSEKRHEVIIGGSGGQGVITIGYALAAAGSQAHPHVTRFPIYLAMQRGGAAYCTVIFSDDKIASPILSQSRNVIAMEDGSYTRFKDCVKPGGNLLVNSSIVKKIDERDDYATYPAPVIDLAQEMGDKKMANMLMLGVYREITGVLSERLVLDALAKVITGEERLKANIEAYHRGVRYARDNFLAH